VDSMSQDTEQSIRQWFHVMERCTQTLDYATARKLMAEDVKAFRAFPEKTESGDSPALTNRIQASCWEEASMDGEAVFGGFA
jgi:hypothetical protein